MQVVAEFALQFAFETVFAVVEYALDGCFKRRQGLS